MNRQRAPLLKARALVVCTACGGKGINSDYHPASSAISDCCTGCNGFGRIDQSLGALPREQIIQALRERVKAEALQTVKTKSLLDAMGLVFTHLHEIAHKPHPAAEVLGTGHLQAKRVD